MSSEGAAAAVLMVRPTPATYTEAKPCLVAVAGNPNCGKTTLFNALTGLRHRVGNYPGVTVERREGTVRGDASIRLLDLPGTYSLAARSLDERIARDVLLGRLADTPRPDAVLVVVDASNLERNLYLASQIIELGLPVVVACNMMDTLEATGRRLDADKLSRLLGVPVVATVGHRGEGVAALRSALHELRGSASVARPRPWSAGDRIECEARALAAAITARGYTDERAADATAVLLLNEGHLPQDDPLPTAVRDSLAAALERLAEDPACDVSRDLTAARYAWLAGVVEGCLERTSVPTHSVTDRLDRILMHKVWGPLVFAGVMAAMFCGIFSLPEPVMRGIGRGVASARDLVGRALPDGVLTNLLRDGVIPGVGNVLAFFPQICVLFLFIAILEDTGYMARAAFLMDRLMRAVGLPGKSFIPLLSCHACAIPGIMATRTIENPRDRLVTILVAPLLICSARLPVYTVLIAACLPGGAGVKAGVMLALYGLGIGAALAMAAIFRRTLLRGPAPTFLMELPPYRLPRVTAVLRVMWDRSRVFLARAGTVILALTIVLWVLLSYPADGGRGARYDALRAEVQSRRPADAAAQLTAINSREAAENLEHSVAGSLGHLIEPLIRPLGYDWRIGVGLLSSVAAREVFVSTMGIIYSVGQDADEQSLPLREQIRRATWPDGTPVCTPLVAIGLMVFYVFACQCVSTITVVRQETNSWRWPAFMFAYMSILAYLAALLVYQVGSALGLGAA